MPIRSVSVHVVGVAVVATEDGIVVLVGAIVWSFSAVDGVAVVETTTGGNEYEGSNVSSLSIAEGCCVLPLTDGEGASVGFGNGIGEKLLSGNGSFFEDLRPFPPLLWLFLDDDEGLLPLFILPFALPGCSLLIPFR